jgi:hypothetical protein
LYFGPFRAGAAHLSTRPLSLSALQRVLEVLYVHRTLSFTLKHVQRQAMRDLWLLRRANGGKLPHGAVLAIVAKYRNGEQVLLP